MIVPISSGSSPGSFAQTSGLPSETNLLMALATMHAQGRIPGTFSGESASRSHHSPSEKDNG